MDNNIMKSNKLPPEVLELIIKALGSKEEVIGREQFE